MTNISKKHIKHIFTAIAAIVMITAFCVFPVMALEKEINFVAVDFSEAITDEMPANIDIGDITEAHDMSGWLLLIIFPAAGFILIWFIIFYYNFTKSFKKVH